MHEPFSVWVHREVFSDSRVFASIRNWLSPRPSSHFTRGYAKYLLTAGLASKCARIRREFRADFHCKGRGCSPWEWLGPECSCQSGKIASCRQQWCQVTWEAANNRIFTDRFHFSLSAHLLSGCKMRLHRKVFHCKIFVSTQVATIRTVTLILRNATGLEESKQISPGTNPLLVQTNFLFSSTTQRAKITIEVKVRETRAQERTSGS